MGAVADTGPLHYLVLLGHAELMAVLFTGVAIPQQVQSELSHPGAPIIVRDWIAAPPAWLSVHPAKSDILAQIDA